MKEVCLGSKMTPEAGEAFVGKHIGDGAASLVVREDTRVFKPNGELLLVLVRRGLSPGPGRAMYGAIRNRVGSSANRGAASGEKRGHKRLLSGRTSNTDYAATVRSSTVGFFDRYARIPYCRKTAFNLDYPDAFAACLPALYESDQIFKHHVPARWAAQMAMAHRTTPDFVIPGTSFTTLTLNKNFRTAGHRDAGDLPEGFGVMTYFRSGKFTGGAPGISRIPCRGRDGFL